MGKSWGKELTENPADKHPGPELKSKEYDSRYPEASASA